MDTTEATSTARNPDQADVGVHCLVVPDGLSKGRRENMILLRAALILSPDVTPEASQEKVAFQYWPREIGKLLSQTGANPNLTVWMARDDAPDDWRRVDAASVRVVPSKKLDDADVATKAWQQLLPAPDLATLKDHVLRHSQTSPQAADAETPILDREVEVGGNFRVKIGATRQPHAKLLAGNTPALQGAWIAMNLTQKFVQNAAPGSGKGQALFGPDGFFATAANELWAILLANPQPGDIRDPFSDTLRRQQLSASIEKGKQLLVAAAVTEDRLDALIKADSGYRVAQALKQSWALAEGVPHISLTEALDKMSQGDPLHLRLFEFYTAIIAFKMRKGGRFKGDGGTQPLLDLYRYVKNAKDRLAQSDPSEIFELASFLTTLSEKYYRYMFPTYSPLPSSLPAANHPAGLAAPITEKEKTRVSSLYFGLRSQPALAKFMRFVVDIEIALDGEELQSIFGQRDAEHLTKGIHGLISVTLGQASAQASKPSAPRTAFTMRYKRSDESLAAGGPDIRVFRPCEYQASPHLRPQSSEPNQQSLPLAHGVVQLDSKRFALHAFDIMTNTLGLGAQKRDDQEKQTKGDWPRDAREPAGVVRGRGIQLIDNQALETTAKALAKATKDQGEEERIFFAEDLVIGYRVDALRRKSYGDDRAVKSWRTLMGRRMQYGPVYERGKPQYLELDAALKERDHSFVRVVTRHAPAATKDGKPSDNRAALPGTHIFSWMGDSLGVQAPPSPGETGADAKANLREAGIGAIQSFDLEFPPAVLRVPDLYWIGMRPVYLHGGGTTLAEAAAHYPSDSEAGEVMPSSYKAGDYLGDPDKAAQAFPFPAPEDIAPPTLLVGPDDSLVSATKAKNDTIERIVLRTSFRDSHLNTDRVRRFVVPPRTAFSRAEMFGVFDRPNTPDTPPGAFERYDLDVQSGEFPESADGKAAAGEDETGGARARVLRRAATPVHPETPYYPDPLAHKFCAGFERNGKTPPGFPEKLPQFKFWPGHGLNGPKTREATPICIEAHAWRESDIGGRVRPDAPAALHFEGADLPLLALEIGRAEEVDLHLWCASDIQALAVARPHLRPAFGMAARLVTAHLTQNHDLFASEVTSVLAPVSAAAEKEEQALGTAVVLGELIYRAALIAGNNELSEAHVQEAFANIEKQKVFDAGDGRSSFRLSEAQAFEDFAHQRKELAAALLVLTSGFNRILAETAVTGISPSRKLKIVHAVDKPLRRATPLQMAGDQFEIAAVRIDPSHSDTTGQSQGEPDPNARWQEVVKTAAQDAAAEAPGDVARQRQLFFEKLSNAHDPGGSRIIFCGRLGLHRASTVSLRVEGSWPDLRYESAIRRKMIKNDEGETETVYYDDPPRADRVLFEIKSIPRANGASDSDVLDLVYDEAEKLRNVQCIAASAGGETAAREIDLRIVATSRFRADFDPKLEERMAPLFEISNREKIPAAAPQTASGGDQRARTDNLPALPPPPKPVSERRLVIEIPATTRPSRPLVTRIEWATPERLIKTDDGGKICRKSFMPRLYLDKSWRESGEHELLAVILAPSDIVAHRPYDPRRHSMPMAAAETLAGLAADEQAQLDETLRTNMRDFWFSYPFKRPAAAGPVGSGVEQPWKCAPDENFVKACSAVKESVLRYVTRWGADAASELNGKLEPLMHPGRFQGSVASEPNLQMPIIGAAKDTRGKNNDCVRVAALLYKPEIDPTCGEWSVDLPIDPGPAHAPVVRLVIARYQPSRLRDPKDNWDLALSEPLLIDPSLRIPAPRTVEVVDLGQDEIGIRIYGSGPLTREPYGITDEVRSWTDRPVQNIALKRNVTSGEKPVQLFDRMGMAVRADRVQSFPFGPTLVWVAKLKVPPSVNRNDLVISIDEFDLHVPDDVIDGRVPLTGPDQLVARPSFFSITVPVAEAPTLAKF
jgi:hypothetical protein